MRGARSVVTAVAVVTLTACGGPARSDGSGGVVASMLRAYNAGRLDEVLAQLDDDIGWSDCDYWVGQAVNFRGKARVADWLRQRLADHDQLEVQLIEEPAGVPPVGAVTYRKRTSDTLRALGFPDGITPKTGTKVFLTAGGDRIKIFANGPAGGSPEACRP